MKTSTYIRVFWASSPIELENTITKGLGETPDHEIQHTSISTKDGTLVALVTLRAPIESN